MATTSAWLMLVVAAATPRNLMTVALVQLNADAAHVAGDVVDTGRELGPYSARPPVARLDR